MNDQTVSNNIFKLTGAAALAHLKKSIDQHTRNAANSKLARKLRKVSKTRAQLDAMLANWKDAK